MIPMTLFTKQTTVTKEGNQKVEIKIYTLLYIKCTNKDLLYNTGNSTQGPVSTYSGKESEKRKYVYTDTHMYV